MFPISSLGRNLWRYNCR